MNVAILRGRLSSPPRQQELKSGDVLVSLEVTTRSETEQAASVPVAWFCKARQPQWDTGQEIVVIGTVRRRFFRPGGGGMASRTEVVAGQVILASRTTVITKAVNRAIAALDELAHPPEDHKPSPGSKQRQPARANGAPSRPRRRNGSSSRPADPPAEPASSGRRNGSSARPADLPADPAPSGRGNGSSARPADPPDDPSPPRRRTGGSSGTSQAGGGRARAAQRGRSNGA